MVLVFGQGRTPLSEPQKGISANQEAAQRCTTKVGGVGQPSHVVAILSRRPSPGLGMEKGFKIIWEYVFLFGECFLDLVSYVFPRDFNRKVKRK